MGTQTETTGETKHVLEDTKNCLPAPSKETIEKITQGFLQHYLPDAQKAKASLDELTQNQRILLETVQHENTKFSECEAMKKLTDMMIKAKQYHTKLLIIKKEMASLHERSAKLKRRALKLQQQKQKEALQREQEKEKEMERERHLMAKPVLRQSSNPEEKRSYVT
ncbi:biogenesis of lysosome-related organelles complex 1 subunit 6 [Lingula anatina]|uniref:Biogenesis of lysosome-related organelles complex 1 subunit 6 n=1 Tax=Lingula anatina TaxID=7574 RepID=A0A1S3JDF3_LINAN|nr:biogenesis of lysosome-related organelles complex 1 subunit 6 [Lingula anatina]|eukprot:XP_013408437.1 biogenesis of lysosome-related organelles complex 1 subunit 6 [Lingula anatina]